MDKCECDILTHIDYLYIKTDSVFVRADAGVSRLRCPKRTLSAILKYPSGRTRLCTSMQFAPILRKMNTTLFLHISPCCSLSFPPHHIRPQNRSHQPDEAFMIRNVVRRQIGITRIADFALSCAQSIDLSFNQKTVYPRHADTRRSPPVGNRLSL